MNYQKSLKISNLYYIPGQPGGEAEAGPAHHQGPRGQVPKRRHCDAIRSEQFENGPFS